VINDESPDERRNVNKTVYVKAFGCKNASKLGEKGYSENTNIWQWQTIIYNYLLV
jgi:hypothetical protein